MRSGNDRRRVTPTAKRMIFDQRGATAAIFAISLPVLVGMGALAVDVGLWSVQKRHAQGAADQAAYSAAIAALASDDDAATLEAEAVAASMSLVDGQGGVAITTNKLDSFDGNSGEFWEVIVEQPQPMWFAALYLGSAPTARARAVAGTASGGSACIIGLDQTVGVNSVSIDQNGDFNSEGCAVYSNANLFMGKSEIPGTAYVTGAMGDGSKNYSIGRLVTGSSPIPDPYQDVTASPPATPCLNKVPLNDVVPGQKKYADGRYCSGFDVPNNTVVNLDPGVYYIETAMKLGNSVTLQSTGAVTLILASGAAFDSPNGLTIKFDAPSSGPYAGIAIMSLASTPAIQDFKNNPNFYIKGALYFPNQVLNLKNNGATFDKNKCTQLVARIVEIKNNIDMKDNCPGSGIRDVGNGKVQLLG